MRSINPQPSLFTRARLAAQAALDVSKEILEETRPVTVKYDKPDGTKGNFGIPLEVAPKKVRVKQVVIKQGQRPDTTEAFSELGFLEEAKEFSLAMLKKQIPNQLFAETADGFCMVVTADTTYMFYQVQ